MKHWKSQKNQDTESLATFLPSENYWPDSFEKRENILISRYGYNTYRTIFRRATKLMIGRCVRSHGGRYFTRRV